MSNQIIEAKHEISVAADDAKKVIASAAEQAAKIITNAAVATRNTTKIDGDHDLLVELKVKMEDLKVDIKELNDGTTTRITKLENGKLDIKDSYPVLYKKGVDGNILEHTTRLKSLETSNTRLNVMLGIGTFLLILLGGMIIYHLFGIRI